MKKHSYKIYCAGPLFNPKEREEMENIASALESSGYSVFLPHRDGLEFARLLPVLLQRDISVRRAQRMLNNAIFCLDVFHVMNSHGLLLNMNGRVPDEGAMVEAGIAWAHNKILVIFRTDDRSLVEGNCNPMVLGLADFEFVNKYEDIPSAFNIKFSDVSEDLLFVHNTRFDTAKENGKEISNYLASRRSARDITDLLIERFGKIVCRDSKEAIGKCSLASSQP